MWERFFDRVLKTPTNWRKAEERESLMNSSSARPGMQILPPRRILATPKATCTNGAIKDIPGEQDRRAMALTEIDFGAINFENCFSKEDGLVISGEEKLRRLRDGRNILLGASAFLALWNEWEHQTLEALYQQRGTSVFEFFGNILEDQGGSRFVLCLFRAENRKWRWGYLWMGKRRSAEHLALTITA